jgi:RNAse (barnase) inhibitor barstar
MDNFKSLYGFLEFSKNNKKYTEPVANNIKSALKIFEQELTEQEAGSIDVAQNNIDEIFIGVVSHNKKKSIASLNAYKARVIRVMQDYQKYGKNPAKIQNWEPKERKSTGVFNLKDKKDKDLSLPINTLVNKIELPLENGVVQISLPTEISHPDAQKIKNIIDALTQD